MKIVGSNFFKYMKMNVYVFSKIGKLKSFVINQKKLIIKYRVSKIQIKILLTY